MFRKNNIILKKAIETLKDGGVILYPTDTIWGLGCDASNEKAIQKIIAIKQRKPEKGFVILDKDFSRLKKSNHRLIDRRFLQKIKKIRYPLTLIYPKLDHISSLAQANDGSQAVRITRHRFCIKIIERLDFPIVSTSANISGNPFPKKFEDMDDTIKQQVDYIIYQKHIEEVRRVQPRPSLIYSINPTNRNWIRLR